MENKIIEFVRKKDYNLVKNIGQGGTGKTVLLKDEIINEEFVCKKYSPYYENHKELFFRNFVDEIKILHKIYHKNIVRVFNYYLYPEFKTGYILMEYIKGENISTYIKANPHKLDDLFVQTIAGFYYLELNKILHRDIRPDNILVSVNGTVKIIDFGFGKKIEYKNDYDKSVTLNWRFSQPEDFKNQIYDFRTEVYFVGKLFEEIIIENQLENFSYLEILSKMVLSDFNERIKSFSEIERKLLTHESIDIEFSEEELQDYKAFAEKLSSVFSAIEIEAEYNADIDDIIIKLENIYRNSMLETWIQNPNTVARAFIKGNYKYFQNREFDVYCLKQFLKFLKSISKEKKRIVLNNLWQRLDAVKRFDEKEVEEDDDLPF